ncbi:MAG TPA: DUF308 domain-containing protein [Candidatus Binatia bacterium]|nr:DUF308 domain-containing protein [Candidatus Binatia bacterium]
MTEDGRRFVTRAGSFSQRIYGALLLVLGLIAILTPFSAGGWAISVLGFIVLLAGVGGVIQGLRTQPPSSTWTTYLTGVLMILGGLLLFARPFMVIGGLLALLALIMAADGVSKIVSAFKDKDDKVQWWSVFNGAVNLLIALLIWRQGPSTGSVVLGVGLGLYVMSAGWTALFAPAKGIEDADVARVTNEHPDERLGLAPHAEFGRLRAAAVERELAAQPIDGFWIMVLILVFFAIHAGRLQTNWSWLGLISPLVAVIGDVLSALLVAVLLLPGWLTWRRITRPIERRAWQQRFTRLSDQEGTETLGFGERAVNRWLDSRLRWGVRLRLTRGSLRVAVSQWLRAGLPIVAVIVAINPIWGFSWYFNTENWASAFWERVTEARTDIWREAMIAAVERKILPTGTPREALFEVRPDGVKDASDFSFLVIGDPGEGDPSQASLRDRYLELGRRPDVKFLVVSSDVIYPGGATRDYEFNFYLPFKGFEKPIYAIPGNHDWFSALDGFAANLMEPMAAEAAMSAREQLTALITPPNRSGVATALTEAARLRKEYGLHTAEQRAPFFEIHGREFSLIAVDTGILRRIDPAQAGWLREALSRARGRFTMVILGHPLYAGGAYQGTDEAFGSIHRLLRQYEIPIVMAGDTHDFEYYREEYDSGDRSRVMHHFVNGGGGAYLSIGTALDWPAAAPVRDWAFYPRTEAVRAKLENETSRWKWPVWWWVKRFKAWPASVEALSGVFDFNHAPFFQSFMEVRVEGSARRVRLVLHGVNGQLRWRDLETGGAMPPKGVNEDDPAEWIVPME